MPTVIITVRPTIRADARHAVVSTDERRVAFLRFVGDAEKIDLARGRYRLEWHLVAKAGTGYAVRVTSHERTLVDMGTDLVTAPDGIASGAVMFDVD